MQTKEREFFVTDEDIERVGSSKNLNMFASGGRLNKYRNKIKITYEIPEKIITITETDFDKALIRAYRGGVVATNTIIKKLKEELFKEGKCHH